MYLYREQKHASAQLYRLLDENMGNKWRYILNVAKKLCTGKMVTTTTTKSVIKGTRKSFGNIVIIIISGETFQKILFIDDFIPSRSLCIKVLLGIYRQALKTVHKSMTQYYYIEERRTLIVSDVLHGVLVLVHPNLHFSLLLRVIR